MSKLTTRLPLIYSLTLIGLQ